MHLQLSTIKLIPLRGVEPPPDFSEETADFETGGAESGALSTEDAIRQTLRRAFPDDSGTSIEAMVEAKLKLIEADLEWERSNEQRTTPPASAATRSTPQTK